MPNSTWGPAWSPGRAFFFLLALLAGLLCAPAAAQQPQRVTVGTFVNNIYGLDLKTGSFSADFYLWFRWKGTLAPDAFEIMNGTETTKEKVYSSTVKGEHYTVYRCQSRLTGSFDFRAYPLDRHELRVEVEDSAHNARELVYDVDQQNSKRRPDLQISGWTLGALRCEATRWVYPTNYGDPALPPDYQEPYSRLRISLPIHHAGVGVYLKTFLALFISAAIAFLSVFLPASAVDGRLGLAVAAVFGAVSSQVLTAQNLPETPDFTLSDKLHVIAYFFIFLTLAVTCFSFYLHDRKGAAEVADRYDRFSRLLLPSTFMVAVVLTTLLR